MACGLGADAQRAGLEALVCDAAGFRWQAGLQRQLRHFHEVFGLAQRAAGQPQAKQVQAKAVAETGLARQAAQVGAPVVLLRVVAQQLFQRDHITRHVAGALLGVSQAQQVAFVGAAAPLFGAGDSRSGVLGDGAVVTAAALQIGLQLAHAAARVAGGDGPVQPFGGLGVVALLGVGRCQLFSHLASFGATDPAMHVFQRLDGGGGVAGTLGCRCLHAVDGELLGAGLAAHGLGFTHLGQRFLGLAGPEQFTGLLQRFADFGAHALGLRTGPQRQAASDGNHQKDSLGGLGNRGQQTRNLHGSPGAF